MANDKQKLPQVTSPAGRLKWPRLTEPDTKFVKEGEYSTGLILTEEEAAPLIAKLQPHFDAAIEAGQEQYDKLAPGVKKKKAFNQNDFYHPVYDDEGNETGEVEFKIKAKASGISKKTGKAWSKKIPIFDSRGKPINSPKLQIWGGSVARIAFEVLPYWNAAATAAGISLRLGAVKIIELQAGGTRNASAYGFGEDEGGYAHEEAAFPEDDDDATDGAAVADEDGDDDDF